MATIQEGAVVGGAAFVAGGAQRWLWERRDTVGWISTAATVLGGGALALLVGRSGSIVEQAGLGLMASGASSLGWVLTEKYGINSGAAAPAALGGRSEREIAALRAGRAADRVTTGRSSVLAHAA